MACCGGSDRCDGESVSPDLLDVKSLLEKHLETSMLHHFMSRQCELCSFAHALECQ